MNSNEITSRNVQIFIILMILLGVMFLGINMPDKLNLRDTVNYTILTISYIYVLILFLVVMGKRRFDLFEPIVLYTVLYILLYSITPLVLMIQNNTELAGIDVMGACVPATLIYMASYTAFVFAYYKECDQYDYADNDYFNYYESEAERKKVLYWAVLIWIFAAGINAYFLAKTGRGLSYVLSFGFMGEKNAAAEGFNLAFLTDIGYGMIGSWYYISLFSRSKMLKFTTAFLTITMFYIRGFRFMLVVAIYGALALHFIVKRKKVSFKHILFLVVGLVLLISVMGFTRTALRSGTKVGWNEFDLGKEISFTFFTNFNIYQLYYGFVGGIPSKFPFQGFRSMLENLIMWIPRAIWPSKPPTGQSFIEAVGHTMDYWIVLGAGMAAPDLGSYYYSFGALGCIIYNIFWGVVCRKSRKLYTRNHSSIHNIILYCLFMPMLFQMVIRGSDLIGFIKMFIFFLYPALLMKVLIRVRIN